MMVSQKDGVFYLTTYKASDILRKVRFQAREYNDDGCVPAKVRPEDRDIAAFIDGVEKSDAAFQRRLRNRKVRDLVNFYGNCQSQPMIPAPVLLFTGETLKFEPLSGQQSFGNLVEPLAPFLIIDGQHRLAGLKHFLDRSPQEAGSVDVPVIIFDGRQEDFAAEMFVTINSTQTRISKSHLIDLMEKVTYGTTPETRWAAWMVKELYERGDSPLQYRINRLGGRSRQDKWIMQSELYNELFKLVDPRKDEGDGSLHRFIASEFGWDRRGQAPQMVIDYLRAVRETFGDAWGGKDNFITSSVAIKAYIRALGDLLEDAQTRAEWRDKPSPEPFARRMRAWSTMVPDFRKDGFYDRFAAKGQTERVRKIHNELARRLTK